VKVGDQRLRDRGGVGGELAAVAQTPANPVALDRDLVDPLLVDIGQEFAEGDLGAARMATTMPTIL
jgi:hypothetical protein